MTQWVIYHNPRCGKSRLTLELLEEHGIEPTVIRYLEHPPTKSQLRSLVRKLGMRPRQLVRTKERVASDLGIDLSDDETALAAMVEHPILIDRPIVVHGDRAILGRPPAKVLELLRE